MQDFLLVFKLILDCLEFLALSSMRENFQFFPLDEHFSLIKLEEAYPR